MLLKKKQVRGILDLVILRNGIQSTDSKRKKKNRNIGLH